MCSSVGWCYTRGYHKMNQIVLLFRGDSSNELHSLQTGSTEITWIVRRPVHVLVVPLSIFGPLFS